MTPVANALTTLNNTAEPCIKDPILMMVPNDEEEAVHLTFDHSPELLCFTNELSSNLGEPKTLHEAMEEPDGSMPIANEIMNFI